MKEKDEKEREDLIYVEQLLKICAKLNVSEIRTKYVHVVFGDGQQAATKKPSKAMIRDQKTTEEKSLLQDEADKVSEDLSTLHHDSPLEYEEAIAKGLLGDEQRSIEENN